MKYEGNILKMRAEMAVPVNYYLPLGGGEIVLNPLVGKHISITFTGQINCISCGKQTKSSFGQGYCYNCMQTSPETSESVLRPELSKSHFGIARDMEWAEKHDLIDHYVYLADSGGLKVGVTRHHQIPTRWIDQGAETAVKLAKTPNRYIAGVIEVFLKNHYSDKTNWRNILKNESAGTLNLLEEKQKALALIPLELLKYEEPDNELTFIKYPFEDNLIKINSLGFDKQPVMEGKLLGIKGQYLIFENGNVVNIRKHSGYYLVFEI